MSTAKVITYKRKRLSSRSGVGHEDVCSGFSLDDQVDKLQDASNKKIRRPEKDLMHACCGENIQAACSSHALQNPSRIGEKYEAQKSDTNINDKIHCSNEFPEDSDFKISDNIVSAGASLVENTSYIKESCLQHSSYLDEGCVQGGSISQSVKKHSDSLEQEGLSKSEVLRGFLGAPVLLTFTRRLKRKSEACDTGMLTKLPLGEGDSVVRKCDSRPALFCTCEGMSKENSLEPVENSPGIKVEKSDVDMGNTLCQSNKKMADNEIGDSSCPCRLSCADTLTLRQTEVTDNSGEDLVVDASPVTEQTAVRTSGLIDSALHHPDKINSTSLCKDDVRCSLYDGTVVSTCNVACIPDEQPVSQHLRASSGESQLTSSDSSDLKIGVAKRVEHRACPPPGAFVIDCNVVPESDVQEDASGIIYDPAKKDEKVMQEGYRKSSGLELFGGNSIPVEDSPDCVHTSIKTENKPETKYLQLFSEDDKCGQFTSSNTLSENAHSKFQQSVPFTLDKQKHKVEQSTNKASSVLGLSLPMELTNEGQTSKDGPTLHQFQNPSVRTCNAVQNPATQSFPKQASFRHKQLLESINTRATSLRGNRNISLDKLEPCPAVWSEEELDSLWIGIRRHGRGNWHAMLLDPRLRFAPWRVAGDLEDQWEREQSRLFSGQHMTSSSRYLKPQDAYKVQCHGPVIWHGTGGRRVNVTTETQLSLGDVYSQKDGITFRSSQSYGITQTQRHVTMASCGPGSYGCGSFNNVQTSVMIGGEISPDGPAMASGMNSCLPHWLRDPFITPRPFDPSLTPMSTLPQMGGIRLVPAFPDTSGTSCRGKNTVNTNLAGVHPPSHAHCGNPSTKKPGTADNLIVIDSDASSEETISDDNNNNARC